MYQAARSLALGLSCFVLAGAVALAGESPYNPHPTASPAPAAPVVTAQPQAAPQVAQPAQSLTGTVQVTQPAPAPAAPALSAADYLDIQAAPGQGKSHMKEYTLTLNNKQARHIEVIQLDVQNGMSEQDYVQMQQAQAQAKRHVAGGMLRGLGGLASIASGFVPYAGGVGSMYALQAMNAGTSAMYQAGNMVESTGGDAVNYTGRVVQHANNIIISPSQQFTCLAVVPENQQPSVKVIFKDLQTNQIYELQK
jgi:hypothetical protein